MATITLRDFQLYIGGAWSDSSDGTSFEDLNPFTGEPFARVAAGTREDALAAVAAAAEAFPAWAATPPSEKQRLFLATADAVEGRAAEIKQLLAEETGCAAAFAGFQLKGVIGSLRQAAGWVFRPYGEVLPSDFEGTLHLAVRRPLGVVASFSPWNGAAVLAWRAVVAPLAYGNTVVLKPSELAPISAGLLLPEIMEEVGWPQGTLNVVSHAPGGAEAIADVFFEEDAVRSINFTGSSATGRILAERAGRALKRITLELGGYNPMIVLGDADLDYAVEAATFSAFLHQGQICMNARKLIVERPIASAFTERLAERARSLVVGDPRSAETVLGPLITPLALERVQAVVDGAVRDGATVLTGGKAVGPCFEPTVVLDAPPDCRISCEETFGPVAVVERAEDAAEAVRIANDHRYGLSASILTGDEHRGVELAREIESGMVRVNDATVLSEPQMPTGGVRDSGWGRTGPYAVEDFTEIQWISLRSDSSRSFPI